MSGSPVFSVVIPVYRNAESIAPLLAALRESIAKIPVPSEVVFVVDGSPDDSAQRLLDALPKAGFASQLLVLSRNFGSINATRAGLEAARGEQFAAIAADLQDPPGILVAFQQRLDSGGADVVFGRRIRRDDPAVSLLLSRAFWGLFRRFVMPEIPEGGVDNFACSKRVRDAIVALGESNTSLVGLLVWVGYPRAFVEYERRKRKHGTSAWSFRRKVRYLLDSVYGFSDLPLRLLGLAGATGLVVSVLLSAFILVMRLVGEIEVPGYTAIMLAVLFFGALNLLGIGVLGGYLWRTFENTKGRANFAVQSRSEFHGR